MGLQSVRQNRQSQYCSFHWLTVSHHHRHLTLSSYTLDRNGFEYARHASALSSPPHRVASWKDPAIRQQINDSEIAELGKSLTGAKNIMVVLATGRNAAFMGPEDEPPRTDMYANHQGPLPATRGKGLYDGKDMGPVRKPHID